MSGSELRLLLPGTAVVGRLGGGPGSQAATARADAVQSLADLYAYPDPPPAGGWVRANMVSTLDGSASGGDGRSGSIGSDADRTVFSVLRGLADVVLVGAGTARAEGYGPPRAKPEFGERRAGLGQRPVTSLALVTRSGRLPQDPALFEGDDPAWVVTCASADLAALRERHGDRVLVAGTDTVEPVTAVRLLAERGMPRVLLEGGPSLLADTLAAGRLDELCLTLSPLLVAGDGPRVAHGPAGGPLPVRAAHLIECGGTLLGRWLVTRSEA